MSNSIYKLNGHLIKDKNIHEQFKTLSKVAHSNSCTDLDNVYPIATENDIGTFKIGSGLFMDNGILNTEENSLYINEENTILNRRNLQFITLHDNDTIVLPEVTEDDIFLQIHVFFDIDETIPVNITLPNIYWDNNKPEITSYGVYDLLFVYDNKQWYGSYITYLKPDNNINTFTLDVTEENTTFYLCSDRHGDNTIYDGLTDWGDGTVDYKLSHVYEQRGTYVIQTKYWFNTETNSSSVCKNITIYELNKCMTNYDYLFYRIDIDRNKNIIENLNFEVIKSIDNAFYECSGTTLNINCDLSNINIINSIVNNCKFVTVNFLSPLYNNIVNLCSNSTINKIYMGNIFENVTNIIGGGSVIKNCNVYLVDLHDIGDLTHVNIGMFIDNCVIDNLNVCNVNINETSSFFNNNTIVIMEYDNVNEYMLNEILNQR